ncbi:SU10 major capsid protein [Ensifer canadensis]
MRTGYQNGASFRHSVSQGGERNTIVATADYYEGPFGTVMIHPNRMQAGTGKLVRNAFSLDTDMLSFPWPCRDPGRQGRGQNRRCRQGVTIGEGTLEAYNEKGPGVVADLFGLSAAS